MAGITRRELLQRAVTLAGSGKLLFRYGPSRTTLEPLLEAIRAAALTIADVTTEETDLEEVFLRLTRRDGKVKR